MALGDRVSKYNKIFFKKCNNKQQIDYQVSVTKFKRYIREFVYDLKEVKNGPYLYFMVIVSSYFSENFNY